MSKQNAAGAAPQENKMGVLPVGKLLAGMAVPMMISMLVQALYNIVDSVFVSRLSENAFNAVGLAFPLQSLMIAVGAGTAVGINALLSRSLGEKKQEMADRAAGAGIFLLPICSYLVFAFIGLFLSRPFFVAQAKAVPEIVEYGVQYTRICLGLSVGIFSQFCFERLLQSTGRTSLAMCTQLLGAIINIVMDPILIFGLCGAPRMGVAGAAVATVVGQIVAAIVGLIVNIKCNHDIHIRRENIRWDPIVAKEIYRVGIPSIIMQSISSVMTFGMNKILIGFTSTAAAVFGVYFKLQSFVYMPVFGMNNGIVPIIAYNYGAGKPKRITDTLKLGVICSVAIMIVGLLLFQLIPAQLLGMFAPTDDMIRLGETALRIFSVSFVFAGVSIVLSSGFQALGNGFYSMIVFIVRLIVPTLPFAWLFGIIGGVDCIWWSLPVSDLLGLIVAILLMRRIYKNVISKMYDKQDESSAQVQQA